MISRKKFLNTIFLSALAPGCFLKRKNRWYDSRIGIFYRPEMALIRDSDKNFSKSPLKPRLFMEYIRERGFLPRFQVESRWPPFENRDFYLAHTREYVNSFFRGQKPLCGSNMLHWSRQFARSIRYTNASLFAAMEAAVLEPRRINLSPASGFHHATPEGGNAFCTMSGQVISSIKIFRKYGWSGAYVDLDMHFGNSIEDSRRFVPDLDRAIPRGCNINPRGVHGEFLYDLKNQLYGLQKMIKEKKVHYLVVAHGADSHEWDDLGGALTTAEWLHASRMVYSVVQQICEYRKRPLPLVLAFFGGYRKNHFESVLALHTLDALICLSVLSRHIPAYSLKIEPASKQIRLSAGGKAL